MDQGLCWLIGARFQREFSGSHSTPRLETLRLHASQLALLVNLEVVHVLGVRVFVLAQSLCIPCFLFTSDQIRVALPEFAIAWQAFVVSFTSEL